MCCLFVFKAVWQPFCQHLLTLTLRPLKTAMINSVRLCASEDVWSLTYTQTSVLWSKPMVISVMASTWDEKQINVEISQRFKWIIIIRIKQMKNTQRVCVYFTGWVQLHYPARTEPLSAALCSVSIATLAKCLHLECFNYTYSAHACWGGGEAQWGNVFKISTVPILSPSALTHPQNTAPYSTSE